MTAIPEPDVTIASLIDLSHKKGNREKTRDHMGCSILGHHCDRWVWLSFRWAVIEEFEGRMLRLFRRGHIEEPTVIDDLKMIGIDVKDAQAKVNFGSYVRGSVDAIAESGVLEAPKARHVVEIKTHNLKSYNELEKKGVKESKPQHWAQMQLYMHGTGIERAMYVAVCKDDDRYYTERVHYDKEAAEKLVARGQRLAMSERMPEPGPGCAPDWYLCKFCAGYSMCWEQQPTKEVNCRTCAHSTPKPDSTFRCALNGDGEIPKDFQHQGCEEHVLHPDMVPWRLLDSDNPRVGLYEIDGKEIYNGSPDKGVLSSKELLKKVGVR